jgi:glycogen debranching enzyme
MIASARKRFLLKIGRETMRRLFLCALIAVFPGSLTFDARAQGEVNDPAKPLLIQRPARTWEFLCSVGKRAGIFGNESGRVEAWAYPLKVMRDFHVTIHNDGKALPAESLVRTIEVRPESTTLVYAGDTFTLREKFFVPVDEAGAVITFEVETEQPLELEIAFHRDFQLEWPAAIGGTYANWDAGLNAFTFGEESHKLAAILGSPTAREQHLEYETNYSSMHDNSVRLGVTAKGRETKLVVLAGSIHGKAEAEQTYKKLIASYGELERQAAAYYSQYLQKTVSLDLPDAQLQEAYDWSRVSLVQGVVTNPTMGTGLVAGYRTSGERERPGFAWFFGRDTFWSSLALNSEGDFANARTALEFVAQFQREDGKIPHEIAQGASFVNWFKDYPYGFASADATPLYIIAMNDYVQASGDTEFAKDKWASLQKAYEFLKSTYDARGLPQNLGIGHGWVEGGPLLPVKSEFYQSGLGAEAVRELSNLALVTGQKELSDKLRNEADKQLALVDESFWIPERKRFAFAIGKDDKQIDELNILATVPMWFGATSDVPASQMEDNLRQLANFDVQTDWGTRIISNKSLNYSGGGYHYGSVWPLFTGWASVAEYRHHQEFSAYQNLRANALLALDGSPGHVTEVLSGDYYQPLSTSSPHQIWSAAMVLSPMLRGMFGLERDVLNRTLTFVPHVPANWTDFKIGNLQIGKSTINLSYHKVPSEITVEITRTGDACTFDFEPALAGPAMEVRAEINGRQTPVDYAFDSSHHHVKLKFPLQEGKNVVRLHVKSDFGLAYDFRLPALGSKSSDLRVLEQTGDQNSMMLILAGRAGETYDFDVWNPGIVESVEGAELVKHSGETTKLRVRFEAKSGEEYSRGQVTIHFRQRKLGKKTKLKD